MNGIEEYKTVYHSYLNAIHDSRLEVKKIIAEGDFVMTHIRVSGMHKGELDGLPPTGNKISIGVFTSFRLVDGKIAALGTPTELKAGFNAENMNDLFVRIAREGRVLQ